MRRYWLFALRAAWRRSRSLFVLNAFGVALGVASVLSIQIINQNAVRGFGGAMRAVGGDSDLSVVGLGPTISEDLLATVLRTPGVAAAWPLFRTDVAVLERDEFFLEVVGVDFYAPNELPSPGDGDADPAAALSTPGWAVIGPELAAQLDVGVGDSIPVGTGSDVFSLHVGAILDFRAVTPVASSKLVVMDIAQAQSAFGRPGRIDQVDARVRPGVDARAVASRLQDRLPDTQVLTPDQRQGQSKELLSAFSLNLTAMSLISLVVGFFLIFSSTQASLVRRRAEFGLLRALGATPLQVVLLILADVLLMGMIGTIVGLAVGYWVATANIGVVSASLTNIYLIDEIEHLVLPWTLYLLAALVGAGGAVCGGLLPAIDMARRDTATLLSMVTLQERTSAAAPRLFAIGTAVAVAVGLAYLALGREWKPSGFVLAFSLLLIVPLLTPFVIQRLTRRLRVRAFDLVYSLKALSTRLLTSSFAVSALAIAVSMMVGITIMIGSFRDTVGLWVDRSVQADVYLTSKSWKRAKSDATLGPELVERLRAWPGVAALNRLRRMYVTVDGTRVFVNGFDMDGVDVEEYIPLLTGRFPVTDDGVLVSEPFFRHLGLGVGDRVTMRHEAGEASVVIEGVYYDYSPEGQIGMDMRLFERCFGAGEAHSLALHLEPDVDAEQLVDQLKAALVSAPLEIRSNRAIRTEVFRIFDQTFAITRILQLMGLLVATCGIALTLLVLARERLPEFALYGALGARRNQVFRIFLGQGLSMAGLGIALGLAFGCALALILVFVINRAYFGWTIRLHWPVAEIVFQSSTILLAAALASIYPALKASRTPATQLTRDDV